MEQIVKKVKEDKMPLQTNEEKRLEDAEKYGPKEDNRMVLYASSKSKKEQNPKYPDFKGYIKIDGVFYEVAGWRNKSEKGTVTLSGNLEKLKVESQGDTTNVPDEIEDDVIPF